MKPRKILVNGKEAKETPKLIISEEEWKGAKPIQIDPKTGRSKQ